MPDWGYTLLGVAGLLLVPMFIAYLVVFIGSAKLKRLDEPATKHREPYQKAMEFNGWAQGNGFHPLGFYLSGAAGGFLAVWKEQDSHRYLTVTVQTAPINRVTFEFTTMFSERVELATSNNLDSWGYPRRPGDYCQVFPKARLLELWEQHVAAEHYLIEQGKLLWYDRPEVRFEESFHASIKNQLRYLRSFPLWQYRFWYWTLLSKRRYANLSVQDQHQREWIRLPHELGIHEAP